MTGRPSVLVCTSGTAAAHYLPAMIEAALVGTPMILLTADRPHELADCKASQTIDQVKLFGEQARAFFELVPQASELGLRALRRITAQAVLTSRWPRAGAVHLNARFRKPLEPVEAIDEPEIALTALAKRVASEVITRAEPPVSSPAPEDVELAASLVREARRGVILCGPAPLAQRGAREALFELAKITGFPLVAEATSQLRHGPRPEGTPFLDGFDLLFRSTAVRREAAVDFVIQVGAPPTSGAGEAIASTPSRLVLAEAGWNDPASNARHLLFGDIRRSASALSAALRSSPPKVDPAFRTFLEKADAKAWAAADAEIAATPKLTEALAVRTLLGRIPEGSVMMLANSLSVRVVDIYGRASSRDLLVLSQRGASGIDGNVASAVGAAKSSRKIVTLVIGDVSLLHDLNSLGIARELDTPFVVFLIHNGGGRIFEQLPLVSRNDIERDVVDHATTPHTTDFAHAAALFGLAFAHAETAADIDTALGAAYARGGATLIQVRMTPSGAAELGGRVTKAVDQAVSSLMTRA